MIHSSGPRSTMQAYLTKGGHGLVFHCRVWMDQPPYAHIFQRDEASKRRRSDHTRNVTRNLKVRACSALARACTKSVNGWPASLRELDIRHTPEGNPSRKWLWNDDTQWWICRVHVGTTRAARDSGPDPVQQRLVQPMALDACLCSSPPKPYPRDGHTRARNSPRGVWRGV